LLKHLLGTQNAVFGKETDKKPSEVKWRDGVEGKVDLFVTLDFRMSFTWDCLTFIIKPSLNIGCLRHFSRCVMQNRRGNNIFFFV
jgi:hypothetical protein